MTTEREALEEALGHYHYYFECDNGCSVPVEEIAKDVFTYLGIDPNIPAGVISYIFQHEQLVSDVWNTQCDIKCRTVGRGEDRDTEHDSLCPKRKAITALNKFDCDSEIRHIRMQLTDYNIVSLKERISIDSESKE